MTLRCTACGRALVRFAVSNVGTDGVEYGWGPTCGRSVVVKAKRRQSASRRARHASLPSRDPRQLDWVEEAAA